MKTIAYKEMDIEKVLEELKTSRNGLSEEEAKNRLKIYGRNSIEEKRENPIVEFLKKFYGPMPWLLEIAIVLSILIEHYLEAAIIAALLVVNAVIGYRHSVNSRRAVELLKSKLKIKSKVLRDGSWKEIDASEIVPGDIIVVGLGDVVPADCKVIEGELSVDQSALTGESLPVEVSAGGIIFSSSLIKRGKAVCVVVNTGKNTYFGKTVELVKIAHPKSHQQEVLLSVTKAMMIFGVIAMAIATAYAIIAHVKNDIISILTFDVGVLMACVPVALPAVMTIIQAVGAMRLASENVLVTRLDTVEDAASVDVIALDKTGTITMNKLSVVDVVPFKGHSEKEVLEAALIASSEEGGDAIDQTVIDYAQKKGISRNNYTVVKFIPFDPALKRAEAIAKIDGREVRFTKGAPQVILQLCGYENGSKEIEEKIREMSEKGYRTLLVARKDESSDGKYEPLGIMALADPPRPDSMKLIEELKSLQIRPKMITGDSVLIAKQIAKEVGIGDKIFSMGEIKGKNEDEMKKIIEEADGFAEVYPEDKYTIVKTLQENGHIVGMTGDGVNDAPALKQAEVGIAVSNASDAAKAAASLVLLEPGLKGIVEAIKVSRQSYQRALTWVINKTIKVLQYVMLMTVGFILFKYDIITLFGVALILFANDFTTISIATDNVISTINPNKWNVKNITLSSSVIGILLFIEGMLGIFIARDYFHFSLSKIQSFVLLIVIFSSQFNVLLVRERRHFWSSMPGKALLISTSSVLVIFTIIGALGIIIEPVGLKASLFALVYSAVFTLALDPVKCYVFRKAGL
ncbi:plasma-membrane proton-efflux P-type ATPase [Fervidicoccus fontis]|nr:plasma-membrane proton-efflux P-type ATPase [Fervidicoccus fontis]